MQAPSSSRPAPASNESEAKSWEQEARAHLAAKKFRKARELFKLLCKINRTQFLPLLIETNIGLAREMLDKGQTSEAQQILNYLTTIAPRGQLTRVQLAWAQKAGQWDSVATGAISLLAQPEGSLPPDEKIRLADQIVVAFEPMAASNPVESNLVTQAQMIQNALRSVCEGQYDQGSAGVRSLPYHSAFSHWKLFIKGLVTFHQGDWKKARRSFAEAPKESLISKAAKAYLWLMYEGPENGKTSAAPGPELEFAFRLSGHAGMERSLLAADQLWRKDDHDESYKSARRGIPGFPGEGLDFAGVLSDFYFNSLFRLSFDQAEDYCYFLEEVEAGSAMHHRVEMKLLLRVLGLRLERMVPPGLLTTKWERFLQLHQEIHGANPRLASLGYEWLGSALSRPVSNSHFYGRRMKVRDAAGAIRALRASVDLDPANLSAHLQLCTLYESLKWQSERNRLLDRMVEQFPNRKEVLVQAGRGCMSRDAFVKGLDYLERARQIDPLDAELRETLVDGYLRQITQYYRKGQLDQGRKSWENMAPYQEDLTENFARNSWCLEIRRGLLEWHFGDGPLGISLLGQAQPRSPSLAAFLLFGCLAERAAAKGGRERRFSDGRNPLVGVRAEARHGALLLRLLDYWRRGEELNHVRAEEDLLRMYLLDASSLPFARAEIVELVKAPGAIECFGLELKQFISALLRRDPKDPLFRYYQLKYKNDQYLEFHPANTVAEARAILEEARRRGDEEASRLIKSLIDQCEAQARAHKMPVPIEEEPFAEDEDEPENEFPEFPVPPPPEGLDFPPETQGLIEKLKELSEPELKQFLNEARQKVPATILNLLIKITRGELGQPPSPPAPGKPGSLPKPVPAPKSAAKPSDPRQPEFF